MACFSVRYNHIPAVLKRPPRQKCQTLKQRCGRFPALPPYHYRLSKNDPIGATIYDNYDYYEAEDAVLGEGTTIKTTDYVSGKKFVDNVGRAGKNITFEKVNVKEAGEHELKVYIVSAGARTLYVKVNDVPITVTVAIPAFTQLE